MIARLLHERPAVLAALSMLLACVTGGCAGAIVGRLLFDESAEG